jgi:hypothetical protein
MAVKVGNRFRRCKGRLKEFLDIGWEGFVSEVGVYGFLWTDR